MLEIGLGFVYTGHFWTSVLDYRIDAPKKSFFNNYPNPKFIDVHTASWLLVLNIVIGDTV